MAEEYVEGLNAVIARLKKLDDPEKMEQALTKATLLVERAAREKAPKGEIARSIASRVEGLEGIVFTPLEYAPYMEYGTGKFSEHPQGGRKEVPWVYVKDSTIHSKTKTIYTPESAARMVAAMRDDGLDAYMTYGQKAQPYMRPALDENRDKILEILGGEIVDD